MAKSKYSATPVPNSPKKSGSGKGTGAHPLGYSTAGGKGKSKSMPGLPGKKAGSC